MWAFLDRCYGTYVGMMPAQLHDDRHDHVEVKAKRAKGKSTLILFNGLQARSPRRNERMLHINTLSKSKQNNTTTGNIFDAAYEISRTSSPTTVGTLPETSIFATFTGDPTPAQVFRWDKGPPSWNICAGSWRILMRNVTLARRGCIPTAPWTLRTPHRWDGNGGEGHWKVEFGQSFIGNVKAPSAAHVS